MLYSMYPSQIRHWIADRGGLKSPYDVSARQAVGGNVSPLPSGCPGCCTHDERLTSKLRGFTARVCLACCKEILFNKRLDLVAPAGF